jgi:hypothetical protein
LREERKSRAHMRDRMIRGGGTGMEDGVDDDDAAARRRQRPLNGTRGKDRDEDELRKAIEESKRSLAEEQAKKGASTAEERDLEKALRMSEEEEAKRRNAVDDSNASALFDDQNQLEAPNNNPFPFIDPTPYATGLQPQFTQVQPQFTSFNPYQQQAQQEAMQAEYLRQQQEWMRQQQEIQAAQAQAQAQAQAHAQQEEWMRQQQLLQMSQIQQQPQQPLMAQPTGFGSNNPFAPASAVPPMPSFSPQPTNPSPAPQSSAPSFNLQGTYATSSAPTFSTSSPSNSSPAPKPPSLSTTPSIGRGQTRADQDHAQLASLFENREGGQDTFGNIGQLRWVYDVLLDISFVLIRTSHSGMATQKPVVSSRKRLVCRVTTLSRSNSNRANSRSLLFEIRMDSRLIHYHLCSLFHVYISFTYDIASLSSSLVCLLRPQSAFGRLNFHRSLNSHAQIEYQLAFLWIKYLFIGVVVHTAAAVHCCTWIAEAVLEMCRQNALHSIGQGAKKGLTYRLK